MRPRTFPIVLLAASACHATPPPPVPVKPAITRALIASTINEINKSNSEIASNRKSVAGPLPPDCCEVFSRDTRPSVYEVAPHTTSAFYAVTVDWRDPKYPDGSHTWTTTFSEDLKVVDSVAI